ncbi:MAG TPA: GAF domain-containing protein, partial [Nitrospirota bacterium]
RGCEVVSAGDGEQALQELGKQPFDLLITDLMMPGMSGAELLSSLRDNPPEHMPAMILMTGKGTVESALDIMKSGVSAFLRKPLNMDELEVAVATAIDRNRLDRRLKSYYSELDMKVEARTRELTLLNRFSSVVNSSFDLDVILKDAVEYLCECLRADASWIYMLDEGSGLLRLKASKGFPDEFKDKVGTLDLSKGYSGRTFREGGAFIHNELPQTGVPIAGPVAAQGFGSAMHAAIKSAENVLGSMGVASRSGLEFQEPDLQILTSFGNQIGLAVEKIRLYESEKAAARDLHKKVNEHIILNEMGNMLRVSIDLELAARAVVSTISQGLGFERVCLWLLSDDGSGLSLKAGKGVDEGFVGASVEAGEEALARVMFDTDGNPRFGDPVCSMAEADLKKPLPGLGPVAVVPLMTRIPESRGVNCWEHFGCREGHCPAFANPLACWMVDESCVRKFRESTTLLDKISVCSSCEVYQKNMKGECIGIICVETQGKALDDDDMKTLGVFANTAAAALENIRLMERMVKSERFIDNIMANMASGLLVIGLDGIVKMINSVGADILRVDQSGIKGCSIVEARPETARFIDVDNSPAGHEVSIQTPDGPVPVGYSNSYMRERG